MEIFILDFNLKMIIYAVRFKKQNYDIYTKYKINKYNLFYYKEKFQVKFVNRNSRSMRSDVLHVL